MKIENWFEGWFNSYHYHILYKHRDYQEAESFIRLLFDYLKIGTKGTDILDLACGRGRHAIHVHNLGYTVHGLDLSPESIKKAKLNAGDGLTFSTGDMRNFQLFRPFDLVLNLFTSFGYFESDEENMQVISSIAQNLKPGGILVLDYLNVNHSLKKIPNQEQITVDNINFKIDRYLEGDFITKSIKFEDQGLIHHYKEFVRVIRLNNFKEYLKLANLTLMETFGDYNLKGFNIESSDRLILIAKKN